MKTENGLLLLLIFLLIIEEHIKEVYDLGPEERKKRGLAGREWALSDEAGFTATKMSERIAEAIDETLENFVPRPRYDLIRVKDKPSKLIEHKLTGY